MNNNLMRKITTTILLLGGGLLAPIVYTSCDNFLDGSKVREDIVDAIAYNNAISSTLYFKADSEMGEFFPERKQIFKVGYETEIQFSVNLDRYVFKGLEAVCVSDNSVSRADYVSFEAVSSNEKKGIYIYNVKLLREAKDILIRPVCIELPEVTQIKPATSTLTYDQDTPIQFTFNKPVDLESFGDFSCIYIYAESDLSEYFDTPVLSADKKTLNISTKKLILPPDQNVSVMNIQVSYDFSKVKDADGLALKATGTHEYKINKNFGNQKKVTIHIPYESAMGSFTSAGEKECTVGYTLDIQFNLNKADYKFIGFEAVSNTNNSESRNASISIIEEYKDYNDETGIYKARVKILEEKNDILIRPVCLELPCVASHTPDSKDPQFANTPIVIKFNMPMEAQSVLSADSIFNYKNISLVYTDAVKNNKDMSQYFEAPYFNAAKDTLTFVPKAMALKNYIDSLADVYIDVKITFNDKIAVEKDGYSLLLKQNAESNFSVSYNSSVETVKPVKSDFLATKNEISLTNLECQKLNSIAVGDMTAEQVLQYRIKDCVYLYGKYYDKDSGVAKVIVTAGSEQPVEFTAESEDADFVTDENGYTQFCIKCNLNLANGVYLVKVAVADACANVSSEEEFTVVSRKTYAAEEMNFTVTNKIPQVKAAIESEGGLDAYMTYAREKVKSDGWDALVNEINSITRNLRVYPTNLKVLNDANITGDVVPVSDLTLYCEYTDKTGATCKQKFAPDDDFEETGCLSTNLNVDTLCGMTVKIIAEDNYGATGEKLVYMPEKTYLSQRYKDGTGVELIPHQYYSGGASPGVKIGINSNDQVYTSWLIYGYDFGNVPLDSKKVGYFFWTPSEDGLYSDFVEVDIPDQKVQFAKEPVVTMDENNCVNVTFELASDTWEKFDKIEFNSRYLDYWNEGHGYNEETHLAETLILTKEKCPDNKFTYKHDGNYFYHNYYKEYRFWYDDQAEFWFTGISETFKTVHGGNLTLIYPLELDEKVYDDRPPVVVMEPRNYNEITFILKDFGNGSGIDPDKDMYMNIENSEYDFDFSPNTYTDSAGVQRTEYIKNITAQQMYDCMIQEEDGTRKFHFTYTASDNAGNSVTNCPYDIELDSEIFEGYTEPYVGTDYQNKMYININNADEPDWADVYCIKPEENVVYYYWNDPVEIENYSSWSNNDDHIYLASPDTVFQSGTFFKICPISKENKNLLMPLYTYYGPGVSMDSSYNYMISGSDNSVLIGSKAPVLVASYTTKHSYDVCKSWSAYEWRMFGEEAWVAIFDFSDTNTTPRCYTCFPPGKDECAVVVAYFVLGNTTLKSDIMQYKK